MKNEMNTTVLIIADTAYYGEAPDLLFHGILPQVVCDDRLILGWGECYDGHRKVYRYEEAGYEFVIPNEFKSVEDYAKALNALLV